MPPLKKTPQRVPVAPLYRARRLPNQARHWVVVGAVHCRAAGADRKGLLVLQQDPPMVPRLRDRKKMSRCPVSGRVFAQEADNFGSCSSLDTA